MGLPDAPEALTVKVPAHSPPRWKRTWSPGFGVKLFTLLSVFQGLLSLVPGFESLPELLT
jgi:hypothetical protein